MPTTIEVSVFINASPEAVARVILDPTRAVFWTSGLERFEVVSGSPGQVGSLARLHYREGERRYVMEDRLLETEPNRRYRSQVTGDALTATVETTLAPSGSGTTVTVRWTGAGRPLYLRLLLPFMRRAISRQASADLVKLKGLVEAEGGV
jgi:hypothetical protein